MHLLVAFASDTSEACRHVLRDLRLPHLARLLALLSPTTRDDGPANAFSPPHERALAAAWGWRGDDGLLPFAAHAAAADGIDTAEVAWGQLTPAHWQLGRDHVVMTDPSELALAAAESDALFAAVRGLFESEGFAVAAGAADRWYIGRADLGSLATASLDRVIGRSVDRWLGPAVTPIARLIRRLQSEVQLVFYTHPVNEARELRGQLAVNSFWLSGCGRAQTAGTNADAPELDRSLRAPLLAADWAGWADAWRDLDAGAMALLLARAERGDAVMLTLCGERSTVGFALQPRPLWQRLRSRWSAAEPHALLETL
ncbi:MAG: hypothetical protein M3Z29_06560 [Pseudomonadota bacterium]|nr:hypothetical protein [Pseudomonadota bacterium]